MSSKALAYCRLTYQVPITLVVLFLMTSLLKLGALDLTSLESAFAVYFISYVVAMAAFVLSLSERMCTLNLLKLSLFCLHLGHWGIAPNTLQSATSCTSAPLLPLKYCLFLIKTSSSCFTLNRLLLSISATKALNLTL